MPSWAFAWIAKVVKSTGKSISMYVFMSGFMFEQKMYPNVRFEKLSGKFG